MLLLAQAEGPNFHFKMLKILLFLKLEVLVAQNFCN